MDKANAIVYCEGAFATPNGKTAHGLVRQTRRYQVLAVVDSTLPAGDAGEVLDGRRRGIPLATDIAAAFDAAQAAGAPASHLVVGLAPDGGRLEEEHLERLYSGMALGLNLDAGLHQFFSLDPRFTSLARRQGLVIRDVRKPPAREELHFFSGKIEEVDSFKVAVLGTDSALGKRTTTWVLTDALNQAGLTTEMVGTGQTAWMQGVEFGVIMDSLVNDFVSGELEHAVWAAWEARRPQFILVEGQGSLMNPAYPGGFEILAATRPDAVILQHAPARQDYDGFPGYPVHPLEKQIQAIELISGRPVVAVTINHEGLDADGIQRAGDEITRRTGLPAVDVLAEGPQVLVDLLAGLARRRAA